MPMLYGSGDDLNLLARARLLAHAIGNAGADPLFPESGLWDGRPSLPCKFLDSINFSVDLAAWENGDFETWPDTDEAEGWTFDDLGGTGTLEQTTTGAEVHAGASAAQINGGTNGAVLSRDFRVRAGEKRRLLAWLLGDGATANGITVRLINLSSARYLNPSGLWVPTATAVFGQQAATYTQHALNYQVESLARCGGRGTVMLRLEVRVASGITAFVDDADDWPAADVLSFHGLSCEDKAEVSWSLSDTGAGFAETEVAGDDDLGFGADQIPNLYLRRSATTYRRWHRVQVPGVFSFPELGELVLCQVVELGRMADWGAELRVMHDDVSYRSANGDLQVYNRTRWPRRALRLPFKYIDADQAQLREARDELWGRAGGQQHNVLIVPRTDENHVLLTRLDMSFTARRQFAVWEPDDLVFSELPFVSAAR